jgi:hypothetical protein
MADANTTFSSTQDFTQDGFDPYSNIAKIDAPPQQPSASPAPTAGSAQYLRQLTAQPFSIFNPEMLHELQYSVSFSDNATNTAMMDHSGRYDYMGTQIQQSTTATTLDEFVRTHEPQLQQSLKFFNSERQAILYEMLLTVFQPKFAITMRQELLAASEQAMAHQIVQKSILPRLYQTPFTPLSLPHDDRYNYHFHAFGYGMDLSNTAIEDPMHYVLDGFGRKELSLAENLNDQDSETFAEFVTEAEQEIRNLNEGEYVRKQAGEEEVDIFAQLYAQFVAMPQYGSNTFGQIKTLQNIAVKTQPAPFGTKAETIIQTQLTKDEIEVSPSPHHGTKIKSLKSEGNGDSRDGDMTDVPSSVDSKRPIAADDAIVGQLVGVVTATHIKTETGKRKPIVPQSMLGSLRYTLANNIQKQVIAHGVKPYHIGGGVWTDAPHSSQLKISLVDDEDNVVGNDIKSTIVKNEMDTDGTATKMEDNGDDGDDGDDEIITKSAKGKKHDKKSKKDKKDKKSKSRRHDSDDDDNDDDDDGDNGPFNFLTSRRGRYHDDNDYDDDGGESTALVDNALTWTRRVCGFG